MKIGKNFFGTMRKSNLSIGMIRIMVMCWLIPYVLVSGLLLYYMNQKNTEQIMHTARTSIGNAAEISKNGIEEAIDLSLQASYDGVIKKSYEKFRSDKDETEMYRTISDYLNKTYKYSNVISNVNLLFNMETDMSYYTYSTMAGATYSNVGEFREKSALAVKRVARNLGTGTKLVNVENHLFLVRNIVTSNYRPFTTLVMEINMDYIFDSLADVMWQKAAAVYVDGKLVYASADIPEEVKEKFSKYYENEIEAVSVSETEGKKTFYDRESDITCSVINVNGQKITYIAKLDEAGIYSERNIYISIYLAVFIMLAPLLIATFYYFYHNINSPINTLVKASQHIEDGEYGYEIEPFHRDNEFKTLIETFNHMSVNLKESFNRIYAEEVAARDAEMKALQSQINPHFLNNTLEIINWKARLSGNEDVSKMISALSVMMNATMNRNNEGSIPIREELKYVDAYLYIIYARFGGKFKFIKEVDEKILDYKIPRLIIQPLVENAVDHGGDEKGNIEGKLIITGDETCIKIQVENNGNLSEENKKQIDTLLSQTKLGDDNKNIGIRNVNLRLKMLYGEQSGLTITNEKDNVTMSEIVIQRSPEA